ncbi:hypothetical protein EYC84_005261 [Monilinia fructicola]|uniref:protein-ribulosamine 3-kinase n=1 Tax=Monilinia fructicola TaxID=38448 RepID=A0A5M9JYF2_MONFR|nr:hypothetical protein EYC84_005261 [Monilinia fructicola]
MVLGGFLRLYIHLSQRIRNPQTPLNFDPRFGNTSWQTGIQHVTIISEAAYQYLQIKQANKVEPRSASTPHTTGSGHSPAAAPPTIGASRELTVVRIPLRSAKHHFGVSVSRGTRPYNEDTYQAGTIELPAFAKRAPISLSRSNSKTTAGSGTSADGASGDPQVFYFGVFDGHGGNECSDFLREELHTYIESTADIFKIPSSLEKKLKFHHSGASMMGKDGQEDGSGTPISLQISSKIKAIELEKALVSDWKMTVGGYFRRFKPEYFDLLDSMEGEPIRKPISVEATLMYAFLKADLDFISAQARKPSSDDHSTDSPLNADEIFGEPARHYSPHRIGGPTRFFGGSTASVAMISTPTPTPFWHPSSPSTLIVAHVGDTRIILCDTLTGLAKPVTTNHHPSSPIEGGRLRRYAATFVTDSFGEERMSGLANTRAFGDMRSKRIGVSAEPEIRRVEIAPAEYSFLVLVSDGVSGTLTDQEIVDVVKEAKTPEQGARDVVSFATEVSKEGDNATCLVVRLGGWERRIEGGMGKIDQTVMAPTVDPAILKALSLDQATTTISKHGGSGFAETFKVSGMIDGKRRLFFVKTGGRNSEEMFTGEHASLNAIHSTVPSLCPKSYAHGTLISGGFFLATDFLDLNPRDGSTGSGISLAKKLAKLHSTPAPIPEGYREPQFGFPVTTCCGETPQDNGFMGSWAEFFGERRLRSIVKKAESNNGANSELREAVEEVVRTVVPRLLGDEHLKGGVDGEKIQPVVVHGDLWSGNHGRGRIGDEGVEDMVFDPSSCFAHSEFEAGIMGMFGGFGAAFWKEYHEDKPKDEPAEEWADRCLLYELYHHLNHYAMFGGGYKWGAMSIMKKLLKKYGREA